MAVTYMPSREVSYEGLLEADWDFEAGNCQVDEMLIKAQLMEKLEEALHALTVDEMRLIQELFCLEKTEREAAAWIIVNVLEKKKKLCYAAQPGRIGQSDIRII